MTKPVKKGVRPPSAARNPKAYALSVAGAVLILVGLVAVDSILLVAVGAALALAGWLLARRGA
ncbi:hypothetical protein ACFYPG_30130 [Micromonospora sp. NPDC005553]|uniref:hypothetical protein n=1 Tax=unclassified Micromonospora TaxID=2617518 RepID=UPI0036BB4076